MASVRVYFRPSVCIFVRPYVDKITTFCKTPLECGNKINSHCADVVIGFQASNSKYYCCNNQSFRSLRTFQDSPLSDRRSSCIRLHSAVNERSCCRWFKQPAVTSGLPLVAMHGVFVWQCFIVTGRSNSVQSCSSVRLQMTARCCSPLLHVTEHYKHHIRQSLILSFPFLSLIQCNPDRSVRWFIHHGSRKRLAAPLQHERVTARKWYQDIAFHKRLDIFLNIR